MRKFDQISGNFFSPLFTAYDFFRKRNKCTLEMKFENCEVVKRILDLQTLLNGTMRINVCDLIYPQCGLLIIFDGSDFATFCATTKFVNHRELLD